MIDTHKADLEVFNIISDVDRCIGMSLSRLKEQYVSLMNGSLIINSEAASETYHLLIS